MSSNVTSNLRNISQAMANVVEQSRGTLDVLGNFSSYITHIYLFNNVIAFLRAY
jgi:hypothetical protein